MRLDVTGWVYIDAVTSGELEAAGCVGSDTMQQEARRVEVRMKEKEPTRHGESAACAVVDVHRSSHEVGERRGSQK